MKTKTTRITGKVTLIGSITHRQPNVHDDYFDIQNAKTKETARVYYDRAKKPRIYEQICLNEKVSVVIDKCAPLHDSTPHVRNNLISIRIGE